MHGILNVLQSRVNATVFNKHNVLYLVMSFDKYSNHYTTTVLPTMDSKYP
jgi:hypothetical protein